MAVCACVAGDCLDDGASTRATNGPVAASDQPQASNDRTLGIAIRFVDAGWNRQAAKSVVELNAEWFQIQAEENPTGLEIQLKLLDALGHYSDLHDSRITNPEAAGLLASVDNPRSVAESLSACVRRFICSVRDGWLGLDRANDT